MLIILSRNSRRDPVFPWTSSGAASRPDHLRHARPVNVRVHHADLLAEFGERAGEVHRHGRFADAALAAGDRDDMAHAGNRTFMCRARHLLGRGACSISILTATAPAMAAMVFSISNAMVPTTSGLADGAVRITVIPACATSISLIMPKETISRLKPGYLIFLSSVRISWGVGMRSFNRHAAIAVPILFWCPIPPRAAASFGAA